MSNAGSHLDQFTFEALIQEALAMVPAELDKRQGSVIYDTLAVGDVQLAQGYIQLKGFYLDTYALTAQGEYLDLRVFEAGLTRYPASQALKRGVFSNANGEPVAVPIGARFSTAQDTSALIYQVEAVHTDGEGTTLPGEYRLRCETAGSQGNDYVGPLIAITYLQGVASATLDELLIPARDTETDEALRARYIEAINRKPFGGNIAHYRQWTLEIPGVGAVQVYPIWDGGGTVKCSILGADYSPASPTLLDEVQTILDPEGNQGIGLGTAPIGHVVTVVTPETITVDIDAQVTLRNGISIEQIQSPVEEQLQAYLLEERKKFGAASDLNEYGMSVYRARVSAVVLGTPGVENVPEVLLNGTDEDLTMQENKLVQQVPVLGTVTLHAV